MIYRFKITSAEAGNFVREVEIGHEQTFLELHNTIQQILNYDNSQMASFYQTTPEGNRGLEIALFEMNTEEDDNMNVVAMDVAMIREFVSKEQPKLIYVFDFFSDRYFTVELVDKGIEKSNTSYPACTMSQGEAPLQIVMDAESFEGINFEEIDLNPSSGSKLDEYETEFDNELDEAPEFENLDDYEDLL